MKKIGFLLLEGLFLLSVCLIKPWTISILDFAVISFAAFRLARTISFNEVAEPLRAPFTQIKPDSCGAGQDVHPKGDGLQYVLGALLSCPICTGTWSALILVAVYEYLPVLVYVLAAAGVSEIIHYCGCWLEWNSRLARVQSGKISPDKRDDIWP